MSNADTPSGTAPPPDDLDLDSLARAVWAAAARAGLTVRFRTDMYQTVGRPGGYEVLGAAVTHERTFEPDGG